MQSLIRAKSSATDRTALSSLFIKEGEYFVKNIVKPSEKVKAYRLRHKIFSEELSWVPRKSNQLEIDNYDQDVVFIGVFDQQSDLKAFLRIIKSESTFMLEKEFRFLLGENCEILKRSDVAEISRLCVENGARSEKIRGNFGIHSISIILYKGVYHWCSKNNIRYLYLVVEEKVLRLLCARGFPCRSVGEPRIMPDGVTAVAAILDWREFEESSIGRNPKMYSWFSQNQATLPLSQSQQLEFC